jgi:hypothetical protein
MQAPLVELYLFLLLSAYLCANDIKIMLLVKFVHNLHTVLKH